MGTIPLEPFSQFLQIEQEVRARLISQFLVLCQCRAQYLLKFGIHAGDRERIELCYRLDRLEIGLSLKWAPPGRHLIQNDTQTEDVAPAVDGFASRLLRRHIIDSTHYGSGYGIGRGIALWKRFGPSRPTGR